MPSKSCVLALILLLLAGQAFAAGHWLCTEEPPHIHHGHAHAADTAAAAEPRDCCDAGGHCASLNCSLSLVAQGMAPIILPVSAPAADLYTFHWPDAPSPTLYRPPILL